MALNAFLKVVGVGVGLILLLVITFSIFGLPIIDSLSLLVSGAFGDKYGIARTLVKTTPLLICGLGMVIAWRAGTYNIGGEGQLIFGAIAGAALFKIFPSLSGTAMTVTIVIAGVGGGALYALLAGALQTYRGTPIVITTILLNFVAVNLLAWVCAGPLQEATRRLPLTDKLPDSVRLYRFDPQTDFNVGALVALLLAACAFAFLFRSRLGFWVRATGENPRAVRTAGYAPAKFQLIAMALSGGLCGLAGAIEYCGVVGRLGTDFSVNWGFLAIPVALLGGLHPIGVLFSALYFGALFAGSENLSRYTESGSAIILVVQGAAVLTLIALGYFLKQRTQARMVTA